jgi:predicted dehydrogenase
MSIGIGLFGTNGHQIGTATVANGAGRVVATAEIPAQALPAGLKDVPGITHYPELDAMLADPRVELVSLCSAKRSEQAAHAIRALRAGKHVYAEKPCAMDEASLDSILEAARESRRMFHEMAGTAFEQPYFAMRQIVGEGRIGEVVQVICEKSYPYHDNRPQDEDVDGGLIEQCAIHGVRMVEHAAGTHIRSVEAMESRAGNPKDGGLRMASALLLRLENGGIASVTANYLNPRGTGVWGYESLRIFGTLGMMESIRGGKETRLVVGDVDHGPLDVSARGIDFLAAYLEAIAGKGKMPLTLEEELSPTRWVIRAKQKLV